VLQRNIPEDWSVKDRISCMENLHLGCKDDIIKIVQVEGVMCINTWGPMGAKGRPNQAEMGLDRSAQASRPGPLRGSFGPPFLAPEGPSILSLWRCRHSQDREPFARRKKTPSEVSPWSMVPCLAPWWGNLLICPWVVIDLEM
jgi:hypothetical protein